MKIGVVQIKSDSGNIEGNITSHKKWIEVAISEKADLIVFPELSLTGYEPELAKDLATDENDPRLTAFQNLSDQHQIFIGVGLPVQSESGIFIAMVIFRPHEPMLRYAKQRLHPDELNYFIPGKEHLILSIKNVHIALAICYESLQPEHSEGAYQLGADLYLASVAKSQKGTEKALAHFPVLAKKYGIPVLMTNCIGFCDNFQSVGNSGVWDKNGTLLGQLDDVTEGLLVFDTETQIVAIHTQQKDPIN